MTIETAITTNIIATSMMILAYSYLYLQYRHIYLARWVVAWIIYFTRQFFLERAFVAGELSSSLTILYGVLSIAYSLLMISGTVEFAGKNLSRLWPAAAVVTLIASCGGVLMHLPFQFCGLPIIVFMGSAYIATGLIFLKVNIRGLGKSLTAGAFLLLGIHLFDMPFLFPIQWFAPVGFLIDGILKCLAAMGVIFVYFERVRNDLAEKEKYYRLLAENATDVIFRYRLTEPPGFEYISPAIRELTGYEPAAFGTVRQILRIIYRDDRRRIKEFFKNPGLASGTLTMRARHKNGDIVWSEQKYSVVFGSDSELVAIEGIVRDVTKRVLLEQDVSRLDRLNIAGQMAANLAHEVRNPLTTVRGYIQMLGSKQEFQHYKERFSMLLSELDRTNHIISEYLSLSKNKTVDMKKCNINNIVMSIYPLIQGDAVTSKVEVGLALGDVRDLFLDDKEIKQLVLNLTRNAIEAMPTGGRLDIRTASSGEEIVLTVIDHGKGIPEHVLNNLGKPFLTTKDNGTGLGMAMCYRIASRHGAQLDIETGPAGTTVHVRFRSS